MHNTSEIFSREPHDDHVILDGATFEEHQGRWHLVVPSSYDDEPDRAIHGDWDDWVVLANHIVALDEVKRRSETGDFAR